MNKLTIVICIIASIAVGLVTIKQRKDYVAALASYKESTKNYQKVSFIKFPMILVSIMMLLAILSFVFGVTMEHEYIWIGVLLIVMSITEYVTLPIRYVLYYDETSFLGEKGKVLYRNIKGYEFSKFLTNRRAVTIKLYNGDDIIVSHKVYEFIQSQIEKAKVKKKELKESRKKHAA